MKKEDSRNHAPGNRAADCSGFCMPMKHDKPIFNQIPANKLYGIFEQAITVLQTLVIALGAGLGIWGVINLLEGYGNDNPGAKSQGMKQLMAGAGVAVVGMVLVPLLSGLFSV